MTVDIVVDAWRDDEAKQENIRESLSKIVSGMIVALSLRVQRIEGITITDRLDNALAAFDDGGLVTGRTLTRTTGDIEGVAMTPVGIRGGKAYCRVFIQASTAEELCQNPSAAQSRYIVAHELGHGHDLTVKSEALEPMLLKTPGDLFTPPVFWQIAEVVWNEYAACRLSANEDPAMQQIMNAMLAMALDRIRPGTRAVIKSCIAAKTSAGALDGVTPLVSDVLKHGSHVIGHSEGLGTSNPALGTDLLERLENVGWVSGLAEQRSILNRMWSSYEAWKDTDVFEPLLEFIKRSYKLCAVEVYAERGLAKTRFYMDLVQGIMRQPI